MSTQRDRLIRTIEDLYPPDSQYADTAEIGGRFLEQARRERCPDWRWESTEVLVRLAALCLAHEGASAGGAEC